MHCLGNCGTSMHTPTHLDDLRAVVLQIAAAGRLGQRDSRGHACHYAGAGVLCAHAASNLQRKLWALWGTKCKVSSDLCSREVGTGLSEGLHLQGYPSECPHNHAYHALCGDLSAGVDGGSRADQGVVGLDVLHKPVKDALQVDWQPCAFLAP